MKAAGFSFLLETGSAGIRPFKTPYTIPIKEMLPYDPAPG